MIFVICYLKHTIPLFLVDLVYSILKGTGFVALCQNRSENRRERSKEAGTKVLASHYFYGLSDKDGVVEYLP